MDDQTRWAEATAAATRMYAGLAAETRSELDALLGQIMVLKEQLLAQTLAAGSDGLCRSCGGQCCLNGKYHFSVLDLLAHRLAAVEPMMPNFAAAPVCPYGGDAGCLMAPRLRPLTCVVFNCDAIEDRMPPDEVAALYGREQLLRETIARAGRLVGQRLERALLLSCDN